MAELTFDLEEYRDACAQVTCETCHAGPGKSCRTLATDERVIAVHERRSMALLQLLLGPDIARDIVERAEMARVAALASGKQKPRTRR